VNWVSPVAVVVPLLWTFGPLSLPQSPLGELSTFIVPHIGYAGSWRPSLAVLLQRPFPGIWRSSSYLCPLVLV
jgi:hypothetical protein